MDKREIIRKIMEKPELRELPLEDAEMALSLCAKKGNSDEENIESAREILHRAYGAFSSKKLLVLRDREPEWILRKHLSTRERLPHYREIYSRILGNLKKFKGTVFDLGAGVNGFSLGFLPNAKYVGVEGIGQLVSLMNGYFKKQGLNARAIHLSLFQLEKLKKLIKKEKGKKVVFLFKVLDSLEVLERDYSKKLLAEIVPLTEKTIVSFATESMIKRKKFMVKRSWFIDFLEENFSILDDFEIGKERYLVFRK